MTEQEYIKHVNKTSRSSGAVGKNPVCYKELDNILALAYEGEPPLRILDYGCGKNGSTRGIIFVDRYPKRIQHYIPYDIGANTQHTSSKSVQCLVNHLGQPFDIVILSNVLNVQPDWQHLEMVLHDAWRHVKPRGRLLVNYPRTPRYNGVTDNRFKEYLEQLPNTPKVIPRGNNLFEVTKL